MIYAIADLHLSLSVNKPMDIFGEGWENHTEKIRINWQSKIKEEDIVFLAGDTSWGIDMEEALADFKFIDSLNGTKFISKGNHDYWWTTVSKMEKFLSDNGVLSINFLHNNAYVEGDFAVSGTKGYLYDSKESKEQNEKIINREVSRLELSLQKARKDVGDDGEVVAILHYPPLTVTQSGDVFIDIMKKYGVKKCYYGHIHGAGHKSAIIGEHQNMNFSLISADYINFNPILIK